MNFSLQRRNSTNYQQYLEEDIDDASDDASDGGSDYEDEVQDREFDVKSVDSDTDIEETQNELQDTFLSRNGSISWSSNAPATGRVASENILVGRPGITMFATVRIDSILSTFDLVFTQAMKRIVIDNTNKYGQKNISNWQNIDLIAFDAFIGLLILAGKTMKISVQTNHFTHISYVLSFIVI